MRTKAQPPRGICFQDALRRVNAERSGEHPHVERGNETVENGH